MVRFQKEHLTKDNNLEWEHSMEIFFKIGKFDSLSL